MRSLPALMSVLILAWPLAALAGTPKGQPGRDGTVSSADGVKIRYQVQGKGEPALVFVHCWTCDRHMWDAHAPAFAQRHTVVTLDLAGHGESGRNRTKWTMPAFAEDVRAVVLNLKLKRVVLIGHSMGGPVILEAARRMPGRVVGLVPVDTLLDVDEEMKPGEIEGFVASLRADYKGTVTRFAREYMFVPATDPAVIERIVGAATAAPPEVAIDALESTWRYDPRPALKEIDVPIRALNADKFPTDLEAARRFAPQYDAVFMKGVGHYLMLEDPKRFNELLREVIAEVMRQDREVKRPRR